MKKQSLNTKNLIIGAIKNKLEKEGANVETILLVCSLHDNEYVAHLKPLNSDKAIKFDIDRTERNMIKKLFISKIKFKIDQPAFYKNVIISIDLEKEDFELYLTSLKDEVTKFEI